MTYSIKAKSMKARVLLIDLERKSHYLFREILGDGYDIETVFNSTQAHSALNDVNRNVDVLVIGDTSHYDSIYKFILQAKERFPNAVRILASSLSSEADIQSISTGEYFGYAPKPWSKDYLKSEIDRAASRANNNPLVRRVEYSVLPFDEACQRWMHSASIAGENISDINSGIEALVTLYSRNITCRANQDVSSFLNDKMTALSEIMPSVAALRPFNSEYPKVLH